MGEVGWSIWGSVYGELALWLETLHQIIGVVASVMLDHHTCHVRPMRLAVANALRHRHMSGVQRTLRQS